VEEKAREKKGEATFPCVFGFKQKDALIVFFLTTRTDAMLVWR